ncbi:MAG: hypothetical protein CMF80_06120 [Candidatus Marinimicrobia bacterium]|nr:hypothetical protein [Candidatus Neomarinimicrobiota bacterium]
MTKYMLYIYMILITFLCFNCSEAPLEIPLDSNRNVIFNVNMSNYNFYSPNDSIKLHIDNNVYDMSNSDDDNIFSLTLNLILGKEYLYKYSVNDSLENLVNYRSLIVSDTENIVSDFYSEINPTILAFYVDMSYQIEIGNFNIETDSLDIAGNFNGWPSSYNNSENYFLKDVNQDNIFEIEITGLEAGNEIEYKFRINGDWDLAEFPGGGPNRLYTVLGGENILEFCFNDEGCN